jgi:peptidyl-dipeptidase A
MTRLEKIADVVATEALVSADRSAGDATAIPDYFAPLKKWLDEQNRGKPVGW